MFQYTVRPYTILLSDLTVVQELRVNSGKADAVACMHFGEITGY